MPRSASQARPIYKRILLKISGEALAGGGRYVIDERMVLSIAHQVGEIHRMGVRTGLVVGGGNIYRGADGERMGLDRVTSDHMGMLATVINALALQDALEKEGVPTRVQSAIEMSKLAEPFIRRRAVRHLEKGRLVIFAGGTGNPYFTTDTAAALRAVEIGADAILKATNVDGVYSDDPRKNKKAVKYKKLKYLDAIQRRLRVMDTTAFSLCMENKLPIVVFDLHGSHHIRRVVCGEPLGTIIS